MQKLNLCNGAGVTKTNVCTLMAEKSSEILRSRLGLSPYQARAYIALISRSSVEPNELTILTGIPRPRAYDVLRGLVSKGLAVEQAGRPVRYSAIDPKHGLLGLFSSIEQEAKDHLGHVKSSVDRLAVELGKAFESSRRKAGEEQRIWVTHSSEAVWAQFLFLKQHCRKEYVGVTRSMSIPPYRIFVAEQDMLKRGVKMRLVRPFAHVNSREFKWYKELMRLGFKFRESEHAPFSFDIFDNKEVVLWLNDRPSQPPSEVAWIHHSPLAAILRSYFEGVWSSANREILPRKAA